jgi:hypothetical protein
LKVVGGSDYGGNTGTITINNTATTDPGILTALTSLLDRQSATTSTGTTTPDTFGLTLPGASAPIDGSTPTSGSPEDSADGASNKDKWLAGLSIAAALLGIWFFFFRK